ncbi:RNA-directed DNA polymerase, eukaryota, reverse transcriptase zinc-binding domain protein [Tanacetum coccineum]
MSSMYRLCRNEGFSNLKIHHIGGLWAWINFLSVDSCNAFKRNQTLLRLFSLVKTVSPNFCVDERMIWVEISGLPLCVWGSNAFKKVASVFGKFMFFESDQNTAMSTGIICIATRHKKFLSEEIQVVINGESFMVHVQELGTWSIDILDDSKFVNSDSEHIDDDHHSKENDVPLEDNWDEYLQKTNELNDLEVKSDAEQRDRSIKEKQSPCVDDKQNEDKVLSGDESSMSYPPGFEQFKNHKQGTPKHSPSSKTSKCSMSFARYRKKDIRGISLIHEISRMIEVGETLGYDVRGCKRSLHKMINGIGVQETKMTRLELFCLKSMWGNYTFDYACSLARGRSGGLVSIWDPSMFVKTNIWCGDSYIIVKGNWVNSDDVFYMVSVYGPQENTCKTSLWSMLLDFMHHHRGKYITFGDWNEVREEADRYGSFFSREEANIFNSFISDAGLVDLPLGGRAFTWMNKAGTKMSKLDRLLISSNVFDSLPDLKVLALDKVWRHVVQNTVKELDEKVDACRATDEDRDTRIQLLQEWDDLERVEAMDLVQKERIKWDVEGDENFKFFHGLINQRSRNGSVLSFDDANSLECMITVEEIKTAVWDCNCNKASGPDGFTFLFVKTYWDLIKDNVASTSILINGSPSSEFSLKRGLRQGDPIPLFLFILVMEGLHLALKEAVQTNLIRGATVGLQININKSNIYGIGVSPKEVSVMARMTSCAVLEGCLDRQDLGSHNNEALVSLLSYIGNIVVDSGIDTCSWNIATNDELPHRLNLSSRGLEITSILSLVCNVSVESSSHLFFACELASQIWSKIRVWCEVPMLHASSSSEWIGWLDNWNVPKATKDQMVVITSATLWLIWRYRNSVAFSSQSMRKCDIFDNIRLFSFSWLKYRGAKSTGSGRAKLLVP